MNIEIANRLVELRRAQNLSQEDLAARLGVSRQAVSKWERAESSPDTDNLIALAQLYGVSLDALLLNSGAATVGAGVPDGPSAEPEPQPTYEPYDPKQYDDGPSLYEQQLHWEAGDEERRHEKWLRRRRTLLTFPYPVVVTVVYLALGFMFGWWHPGWMLYLTVPIYYCVIGGMK